MPVPYIPETRGAYFYRPPTLQDDFDTFLNGDLPNQVMDFELVTDWSARSAEGYEPVIIRGELYPDSTKSRYEDTDNNMNIRCSLDSGIEKGDIVVASNNNQIYLLDWEVAPESNNRPSRALRCNMYLSVKRWRNEEVGNDRRVIVHEGWESICEGMPANAYRYDGRPEYSAINSTPGIAPNALTILSTQFNPKTQLISVDDRFDWGKDEYTVIDVNYVGIGLDGRGVLKLQARKTAGGHLE